MALTSPIEAYLRMVAAAASDVAATATRQRSGDPLDRRDPDYIRETLPALRLMSKLYFRADVRGLQHIPREGPALLVGNHSGGLVIADTFVFAQAFYDHFGPRRVFHQLAHDLVFNMVGLRTLVERYGTVPASPANMQKALARDGALLVYPGGDHETFRPTWQSSDVDFAGRTGFAKLALEHEIPVIPVVAIGGQETALFLGRGRRLARGLGLDRLMRLKVLPPVLGPPFGLQILDMPWRFPLPSKISIRVLKPLDLRKRLGREAGPEDAYKLVTSTMQRQLTRLGNVRRVPVVG